MSYNIIALESKSVNNQRKDKPQCALGELAGIDRSCRDKLGSGVILISALLLRMQPPNLIDAKPVRTEKR